MSNLDSDKSLIDGLKREDDQVIREIALILGPKIIGHVMSNSGTYENGKEVLHLSLIRSIENMRKGENISPGKLQAYIARIAINIWFEMLRERKKRDSVKQGLSDIEVSDATTSDIKIKMLRETQFSMLYNALAQLKPSCKELIKAFYLNQEKLKDIAIERGEKYNNLKFRMHYCMNKLRDLVRDLTNAEKL